MKQSDRKINALDVIPVAEFYEGKVIWSCDPNDIESGTDLYTESQMRHLGREIERLRAALEHIKHEAKAQGIWSVPFGRIFNKCTEALTQEVVK